MTAGDDFVGALLIMRLLLRTTRLETATGTTGSLTDTFEPASRHNQAHSITFGRRPLALERTRNCMDILNGFRTATVGRESRASTMILIDNEVACTGHFHHTHRACGQSWLR